MTATHHNLSHSAEAAALGFYYQTFYALLLLLKKTSDNATIGVETLDDVELETNGQRLLFQLKHSMIDSPPPITLKSRSLWSTIKVWIDALPELELSETRFHLIAVAKIPNDDVLTTLTSQSADRRGLAMAMKEEAQRVIDERLAAAEGNRKQPYANRFAGCEAFLGLSESERLNLLRRTFIEQGNPKITDIEDQVVGELHIVRPSDQRMAATRLIEWWDLQIVYSLCGKRDRLISRAELQNQVTVIIGDLDQEKLFPDFEMVSQPENYQPDGMLARQIDLVKGKRSDLSKAIREEWRAREQRSKWLNENPSMATVIGNYDQVLQEYWSDRHEQMAEDCGKLEDHERRVEGLKLLRWTHEDAPNTVRPIDERWNAAYYVRGSYQVLAINLKVGWHPDFADLLGEDE